MLFERGGYVSTLFESLEQFHGYAEEVKRYRDLFEDVKSHIGEFALLECDFHLLQLLIRNLSILLCNASGKPTFGRRSAYDVAKSHYPLGPFDDSVFDELTDWHLRYTRNIGGLKKIPDKTRQRQFLANVEEHLDFCAGIFA